MNDIGFWGVVFFWIVAFGAWVLLLGMVRSLGKAWRNER